MVGVYKLRRVIKAHMSLQMASPNSDKFVKRMDYHRYNNIPTKNSHVGSIMNWLWRHGRKDISQITQIVWKSQWFVRVCLAMKKCDSLQGCTHTTDIFEDVFIESFTQVSCFMFIFVSSVPFMMTHSSHIILRVRKLLEIRLSKVCLEPVFLNRGRHQLHVWKII